MTLLWNIFLAIGVLCSIGSLGVLIYVAVFLVNFQEKLKEFFADLVDVMENQTVISPTPTVEPRRRPQTWDEKYEAELDERRRRLEGDSGLIDPAQGGRYSEPPAPREEDGLNINEG